ncbi:hypothetical protein ACP70R_018961 [Stipagrostis hirtigluma subsp. patula]
MGRCTILALISVVAAIILTVAMPAVARREGIHPQGAGAAVSRGMAFGSGVPMRAAAPTTRTVA